MKCVSKPLLNVAYAILPMVPSCAASTHSGIWVLLFPGNHACESFIESGGFMSHTSCSGEENRCEDTTFYVSDTLTILYYLQQFVFPVGRRDVRVTITGWVWVENLNVKNASCDLIKNSHAWMSRQAPSSVFWERRVSVSPVKGCISGSMAMLWQTSVRRDAMMSRILIWSIVGNSPMWHIIAWSTKNTVPQLQVWGVLLRLHPYLVGHLWMCFYEGKGCGLPMGECHAEEPSFIARLIECLNVGLKWLWISLAWSSCLCRLLFRMSLLVVVISLWLTAGSELCATIKAERGAIMIA